MKPTQATILTALGLMLAAGAFAGANASTWNTTRSLSSQIKGDIAKSIRANAHAATSLEWENSGYKPRGIFENVRDLRAEEANQALCEGLAALADVDLSLFEGEIGDDKNRDILPCAAGLQHRIERHWSDSRANLDTHRQQQQGLRMQARSRSLPSLEVEIDTKEGPILTRGGLENGQIALTFDDGPHATRTPRILEILQAAGVRVVFFQVGQNAQRFPDISKQASQEGHIVASHTWSHPQLPKLAAKNAESEIRTGREAVSLAAGVDIPFFRFPYGAKNAYLERFIESQEMASFLWNMDTLDWKLRDPKVLLERTTSQLDRHQGGIMLFHDIHEQTVIVLPYVLDELRARGFSTVVFVPKE